MVSDTLLATVKLTGTTRKGKQRVSVYGAVWDVIRMQSRVGFSPVPGRWLLVRSRRGGDLRWVHVTHDDNFSVEFI